MKHDVNLLPAKSRMSNQWRQQMRGWAMIWVAATLILGLSVGVLDQARKTSRESLRNDESQIVRVRQTEASLKRLAGQAEQARKLVNASTSLEQTDAPLALFQLVHQCCQKAGEELQLQAWRMSESLGDSGQSTASQKRPTGGRARNQDGKEGTKIVRKQIVLNGQAAPDACLSLVSWLRASGAFRSVILMSTQTLSDEPGAWQSFQIRCEQ